MHRHPVKRGRVSSLAQWPWSSFSFDYLSDSSALRMDRLGWFPYCLRTTELRSASARNLG
jgi:hypothetical protein